MVYAEKTFKDPNRIKRFFQERRLHDALALVREEAAPGLIIDLGAGDGELCKRLAQHFPAARIVCYEPHPELARQARANLRDVPAVEFCSSPAELPGEAADLVFCLEVFEHLPPAETQQVLSLLQRLLGASGRAVIGVPIETGLPALYKGLFRMARRFGEHDARPGNIMRATLGRPPADRPTVELMPGSFYHLHHLGFDLEKFRAELVRYFAVSTASFSPFSRWGRSINSEAYFLASPRPQ